jgi:hypothetical protein
MAAWEKRYWQKGRLMANVIFSLSGHETCSCVNFTEGTFSTRSRQCIVTCRECARLVGGFWIGWLDLLTPYLLVTTSNTALSLIYTLYKALGLTTFSQSSIVVSWQRIYNSLTITAAHYKVFFCTASSLSCHFFWIIRLPSPEIVSSLFLFKSQSHIAIDSKLVSLSWCRAPN